jgi:carbonic anhydrase
MSKRSEYLFSAISLWLTAIFSFASSAAVSAGAPHREYSGDKGADHRAKLTSEYGTCASRNRSPINVTKFVDAPLKPVVFKYFSSGAEILNNGRITQANISVGNTVEIDGVKFELKQFHVHAPGEKQINGKSFPLEVHLVHADRNDNLAIVVVMVAEGEANKLLAQVWENMPQKQGDKTFLRSRILPVDLLPTNRDYYHFSGSLTTPPCSEGGRWIVMKESITASKAQIDAFVDVMHQANNRPIQPVKARLVLE